MAIRYAGIMALIGMSTVLLRALRAGSVFESTTPIALGWLAAFGGAGWLIGMIAESTVAESVRNRLEQELSAIERSSHASGEAPKDAQPAA